MKPSNIFDVLDLSQRIRRNGAIFNPLFVGPPGVGKSHIVQEWANSRALPFIDLRIAYMEAPDLIGFPSIETKNERQLTVHNMPEYLPTEGEGVLLLEEPNRGTTSVMNCLMQLLTDRKIHKYTLPSGWIIVGCINPESAEYDVNTMDAALKDRFEMFTVSYDKSTFLKYIRSAGWHKDIINFIEAGLWTYKAPEEVGNIPGSKYVSPRTLSKLNAVLQAGFSSNEENIIYETILGRNIAKDFYNFRHDASPVTMADIQKDLKSSLNRLKVLSDVNNYKSGMIAITVSDIIEVDTIDDETLAKVVKVLPVEQSIVLIQGLELKRKDDKLLIRLIKDRSIKDLLSSVVKYGK